MYLSLADELIMRTQLSPEVNIKYQRAKLSLTVHDTVTVIAAPAPPVGVPSQQTSFVPCTTALVLNIRDNNQVGNDYLQESWGTKGE